MEAASMQKSALWGIRIHPPDIYFPDREISKNIFIDYAIFTAKLILQLQVLNNAKSCSRITDKALNPRKNFDRVTLRCMRCTC
jgi:hypothetical protein